MATRARAKVRAKIPMFASIMRVQAIWQRTGGVFDKVEDKIHLQMC